MAYSVSGASTAGIAYAQSTTSIPGIVPGTSGVAQPFFWDITRFDMENWDVTTVLSASGVTERLAYQVIMTSTALNTPFSVLAAINKAAG